ncbi:hypothetical protein CANINC_002020 [Pichia inconspicua]|uniref:non-specific serine/threonine protein kinase n=1 Tax=Pichia inconspicua TaxID=52247 RepID=A0A4T0X3H8_9ASCO|nr:hypothetical protein CANINC_002020 [[Candida] inconspicua]
MTSFTEDSKPQQPSHSQPQLIETTATPRKLSIKHSLATSIASHKSSVPKSTGNADSPISSTPPSHSSPKLSKFKYSLNSASQSKIYIIMAVNRKRLQQPSAYTNTHNSLTPSGSETSNTTSHGREITVSIKEETEEENETMSHPSIEVTESTGLAPTNSNQNSNISHSNIIPHPSQQELILKTKTSVENPNLSASVNNFHRSLLIDSDDSDSEIDEQSSSNIDKKLKSEENIDDYRPGGYHPVFIGEKYGRNNEYLIARKLGWGHFSTVWLAWDEKNQRHVAIKIVRSSNNYTEAALDEIKILEKINNEDNNHEGKKHIVKLFDHFLHEGPNGIHVCMVFEVLGENMLNLLLRYKEFQSTRQKEIGEILEKDSKDCQKNDKNLKIHINNLNDLQILSESYGGLPLTLVKQISKQLLLALDYLHRICGIIHTDIKPENILVEIHDVEKLVELLEFERRNKKMEKILRKRELDHSHSHSNSVSIHPDRFASISTSSSNSLTPITPYQYHSLSRSISTNHSFIPHNHNINHSSSNNNLSSSLGKSGGPLSRKNSIPVRTSKPLTSPVETSSVNNFFRSFSFSQHRTPSFSSNLANFVTPSINNNNNTNSPLLDNSIDEADIEDDHIEIEKRPILPNFQSSSTLMVIPQSQTQNGSISDNDEDNDGDVYVDAILPTVSLRKNSSLHSLKTIPSEPEDDSSNKPAVPFPSPSIESNTKPTLKLNTSIEPSTSQNSILSEFEEIISIKIADLGNACWYNKHYTSDIQTRQYRAPEVILGGDWGCSTDLWSTACLIFELITSDYLFDAKGAATYSRDDDHLAQIVELLQCWPQKDYLRTCKRWRDFFDRNGQNFKRIGKLKIWPLKMVLIDEYKMSIELAEEISDFLLSMLNFDPRNRIDAGSMCSHPWIKDVPGGNNIGRKFGLHGEDIKGYYEEWD